MNIAAQISRFLVGGLFVFSGLVKVNDPVGTAIKFEEYFEVFAADFAPFFSYLVPAALVASVIFSVLEVVLGVAVLLNYRMKITLWILLGLIVFFTFLTFYSAYFNKVTDCGCFGDAIKLTPWQSFTKDIILLVLILIMLFNRKNFQPFLTGHTADIAISVVTLVNITGAILAIQYLPYIDFRAYKVGADIPELMQPSEELKYKYIMTKDGKEEEFLSYPTEGDYEFKEMVLLNPEAQPKITDYSVWNPEGDFTENTFEGTKLMVVMYDAQEANVASLKEIKKLISQLPDQIDPIVLTASGEEVFESFRHEHQLAIPYYFADATVLKTIIRANPGLVLMQDGVVIGKWHHNDVPDFAKIRELLNAGIASK